MEQISFYRQKKTMRMVRRIVYGVIALSWLCVASVAVAALLMSFGMLSSPRMIVMMGNTDGSFEPGTLKVTYPMPRNNLQREVVISSHVDRDQSVSSSSSSCSESQPCIDSNELKNQTVAVRKIGNLRREKIERGLAGARAAIRRKAWNGNFSSLINDTDYVPDARVYHNPSAFYQSYREMEKRFKVYVYKEGDLPIAHDGPCKNIYSIEGRFIHEMEQGPGKFRTEDGEIAHVYFMPFSVTWMVKYLHKENSHDQNPLRRYVADYVDIVSKRYPFWNRTNGADHFFVACHDWGPHASEGNPFVYNTSIRVLCNANSTEGFNPEKDVTLPEIHLLTGDIAEELLTPPPFDAPRQYLGFFAGGLHGQIRPILLDQWKGQDKKLLVYEYLPKNLNMSYHSFMLSSKFCLCPSGYEVASPRVVEAIYAECVPVILSQNYVLPFSDVLNWDAFSITVDISDMPRLKEILSAIPEEKYRRLKKGLKVVRKHFVLNQPAERFDVFHMLLHSIWLRRMNFAVVQSA